MARLNPDLYSVSHSEMEVFKDCRRKWMLHYHLGLRRRREPRAVARDTGVLVHDALDTFYTLGGLNSDVAVERSLDLLRAARDTDMLNVREDERSKVEETHALAELITEGYFEWLADTGADTIYEFHGSEEEIIVPSPVEGVQLLGRLDLTATHRQSGDLVVMDTKVVGSIDDMIKSLGLSEQGPTYALLAKVKNPEPDRGFRVVWNMLKRNKRTARANPPFYQRYELAVNDDQLRQFYGQLHGQISDILRTEQRLLDGEPHHVVAYPRPSKDCSWKCPFVSLCSQMNDPRSDAEWTIQMYYTTPEQRKAAKLAEAQDAAVAATTPAE